MGYKTSTCPTDLTSNFVCRTSIHFKTSTDAMFLFLLYPIIIRTSRDFEDIRAMLFFVEIGDIEKLPGSFNYCTYSHLDLNQ